MPLKLRRKEGDRVACICRCGRSLGIRTVDLGPRTACLLFIDPGHDFRVMREEILPQYPDTDPDRGMVPTQAAPAEPLDSWTTLPDEARDCGTIADRVRALRAGREPA